MEEEVKMVSNFSPSEVTSLIRLFKRLDKDNSGIISQAEILQIPQFKMNPFTDR